MFALRGWDGWIGESEHGTDECCITSGLRQSNEPPMRVSIFNAVRGCTDLFIMLSRVSIRRWRSRPPAHKLAANRHRHMNIRFGSKALAPLELLVGRAVPVGLPVVADMEPALVDVLILCSVDLVLPADIRAELIAVPLAVGAKR